MQLVGDVMTYGNAVSYTIWVSEQGGRIKAVLTILA